MGEGCAVIAVPWELVESLQQQSALARLKIVS